MYNMMKKQNYGVEIELTGITRTFGADPATGIRDIGITVRQDGTHVCGPNNGGHLIAVGWNMDALNYK